MHLILTASKDTYITNKVINNSFRAEDANVGHASTLDLFKLYDETSFQENQLSDLSSLALGTRAKTPGTYLEDWNKVTYVNRWERTQELETHPTLTGTFDAFGTAVSLYGTGSALVGAETQDNAASDDGAAYIYELNGGSWDLTTKLTASDGAAGDRFGCSVAHLGTRLVVGARQNNSSQGAAYVYDLSGNDWLETKLTGSDTGTNDFFGSAVDANEDYIAVAAGGWDTVGTNSEGAIYVYEESGGGYIETRLTASDSIPFQRLGYLNTSISVYEDYVVAGAPGAGPVTASYEGAIYVYQDLSSGGWAETKLTSSDAAPGARFGRSVSIYDDIIAVGAPIDTVTGIESGAAYIFEKNTGGTWEQVARLIPDESDTGDEYGTTVSIYEDTILVGAYLDDDAGLNSGAVYVYQKEGSTWVQTEKIIPTGPTSPDDFFGLNISLIEDTALIGAYPDEDNFRGAAYIYDRDSYATDQKSIEISKLLIKFGYDHIQELTSSIIDINDPGFRCHLKLKNMLSAQAVPKGFNVVAYPLSKSFGEGEGRDVISFGDLDVCNFITASYSGGSNVLWNLPGASAEGLLGSTDIDVITSGNIGGNLLDFGSTQYFDDGTEDLSLDITNIVSSSLAGDLENHGIILSFSGSEESDDRTRFVKRFGSRHTRDIYLRPELHVTFDDSLQDNHRNFEFDLTGSLFLTNYQRNDRVNILSGSSLAPITGSSCAKLTLVTGTFSRTYDVSQYVASTTGDGLEGVYFSTFAIPYSDVALVNAQDTISDFASKSGSITFNEYWHSNDGTLGFYTGSLTVTSPSRSLNFVARNLNVRATNLRGSYLGSEKAKIRLFGLDTYQQQNQPVKVPRKLQSIIFDNLYYRVVDSQLGKVVIPFGRSRNSTLCSTDDEGMYFEFDMSSLYPGRIYHFEFMIVERGSEYLIDQASPRFRVD